MEDKWRTLLLLSLSVLLSMAVYIFRLRPSSLL
jgi:uncharacterized protein YpmS